MFQLLTKDSMTTSLVSIRWDRPVAEAQVLMEENRIRHLPVVDAEGQLTGILSDRDVNRAMSPRRPVFLEGQTVSHFMSWPAMTVDEEAPLADLAEGMVDEKVSAFLVTRGGREVVGIVTSEDLLRLLHSILKPLPSVDGKEKPGSSLLERLPYSPVVREALREIQSVGI